MLQAYYGIEDERLWQLATALGAGLSRQGLLCGALTGGALSCGLAMGRGRGYSREEVRALREDSYSRVQQLTATFREQFGTVECRAMTGCDFLTPQGQEDFKRNGVLDRVCRPAVRLVVEKVVALCG